VISSFGLGMEFVPDPDDPGYERMMVRIISCNLHLHRLQLQTVRSCVTLGSYLNKLVFYVPKKKRVAYGKYIINDEEEKYSPSYISPPINLNHLNFLDALLSQY